MNTSNNLRQTFFPLDQNINTTISYLSNFRKQSNILYWMILLMIVSVLICLPFVYTTMAITVQGVTRPANERTEIKPVVNGIIDTLFFKEGDRVKKGDTILRFKDPTTPSKKALNHFEITQRQQFIRDLNILTSIDNLSEDNILELSSPLYKEELGKFIHQKDDQEASLRKANKELEINTSLANEKVISPKEFFDFQNNSEKNQSAYKAFIRAQLSIWQQDLARYKLELSQYQQQLHQVNVDASYYIVKAPVSGVIQNINTRYAGNLLQANETICTVSPEGELIGECYVQTRDVGLLKDGLQVRYQIEAFDYNYFGILTGRIISIDNDFTVINNTPIIKVRCSFDSIQLHLKNGFNGQLKKGLNFQARFIVAKRNLWQLLFDRLDNWLNPIAPNKVSLLSNSAK